MPSHAIDPFKYPPLEEEDEIEEQADGQAARRRQPSQHAAAAAAAAGGVRSFVHHLLPDTRSQLAFAVAFLAALGVSLYWLIYTIQSKWLYGLAHPQQVVTFEKAKSLPALFGIAFAYLSQTIPVDSVYFATVQSGFKNEVNSVSTTYLNQYINCTEMNFFYKIALCQPTDAQGRQLIHPSRAPAGETDGSSASRGSVDLSPNAWPLQFYGQTDLLCLTAHTLVNETAIRLGQEYPSVPVVGLVPLSAQSTLAVLEVAAKGNGARDDPAVLALTSELPTPQLFTYNTQHLLQFKATKTIRADGSELLEYQYDSGRDVPVTPEALEVDWAFLLSTRPAEEQARLARLKSLPDTKYMQNHFCFVPSSMTVQVITEVTPYGVVTFLSDLGGFLNLLTVALLFLFPLAFKATEPRTFIVLMLADKWRARKGQGKQQQQQGQDQKEMTQRQSGGHSEAQSQSQSQPPSSLCIDMAPLPPSPPHGEAEAAAAGEHQRLDVSDVPSDTMQL